MEHATGTVEKAVDLLFRLHAHAEPLGVTALGRELDMPKSSVHRLLQALGRRGLVERDERGRYRPGAGLVALGAGVLDRDPVVASAREVLPHAVAQVGETFFLVCAQGDDLRVLEKSEGAGLLRASPHIGSTVPLHCTAVGRLHMAYLAERFPVARVAATAGVDAQALAARVQRAAGQGWDHNFDEWQDGLSVIGAPVLVRGRLRGAVALAAASQRLQALGGLQLAPKVVEVACIIAARLDTGRH